MLQMKTYILVVIAPLIVPALISCSSHDSPAARSAAAPVAAAAAASPASLVGKTLVLDHSGATDLLNEGAGVWKPNPNKSATEMLKLTAVRVTPAMELGQRSYVLVSGQGSDVYKASYDYIKTGAATARLSLGGYEDGTDYQLNFVTENTGTATYTGGGEGMEWKGSGLKFIIK